MSPLVQLCAGKFLGATCFIRQVTVAFIIDHYPLIHHNYLFLLMGDLFFKFFEMSGGGLGLRIYQ